MTKTSPLVSFGIGYELEIKEDSTPSMPDLQAFSKVNDLRTDNATNQPYATYEPDFWLLDGNYKFLPAVTTAVHIGIMSTAQSDDDGAFDTPPVLTITFTTPHSLDGLVLRFSQASGDWADDIDVAYYDAADSLIQTNNHTPAAWEFSTDTAATDFQKIVITFNGTNKAYRYLRLTGIDYGEVMTFTGASIKAASVVEESDPLSAEARISTLNLRLFSEEADFSIINPAGDYSSLADRQPLSVSETIGNASVFIGQYYIDKWSNPSDTEIEFECIDLLGVLDTQTCKGGIWLGAGIALEDLLEDLLTPLHAPYDLEASLYGTVVKGWLPVCTYREALQQIAFAVGAYINTSRDRPVKIYPTVLASDATSYDFALTKADKGIGSPLSLRPLVTGVEITAHDIIEGSGTLELYNGTLATGTHEITFKQPMHDLSVTGATISASGANYATLSVASTGTVVLSGEVYTDTRKTFSVTTAGLPTSVKPNVLKVEDATLVNSANAAATAQRVYDYYQQRLVQDTKLYASLIEVGNVALVDTLYNKQIIGVVEKQSIDLARGFVAQVQIVGVEET